MRKAISLALAAAILLTVAGCSGGSVSAQDVKGWAQAHDANGKPIADQPAEGGR